MCLLCALNGALFQRWWSTVSGKCLTRAVPAPISWYWWRPRATDAWGSDDVCAKIMAVLAARQMSGRTSTGNAPADDDVNYWFRTQFFMQRIRVRRSSCHISKPATLASQVHETLRCYDTVMIRVCYERAKRTVQRYKSFAQISYVRGPYSTAYDCRTTW